MAARRVRAYLCKPQYHSNNSNGCPAIPENWTLGHTNNPFGFPSYTGNSASDPGFYNMEINGSTPVVGDGFWVTINAFGQNSFDPNYGVNSNSTPGIMFGTVTYPSNACSNPIINGVFNQGDPDYPNWISRVRFKVISVEPLIVDPNNGNILQDVVVGVGGNENYIADVVRAEDGNIYYVGISKFSPWHPSFRKLDQNGNFIMGKQYVNSPAADALFTLEEDMQ